MTKSKLPPGFAERLHSGGEHAAQVLAVTAAPAPPDALAGKDLDTITTEINSLKVTAGTAFIEIGRRLSAVKSRLEHGQWLEWLAEGVDMSERGAERYMQIAREWGDNPTALADLGATKALSLLTLPREERQPFIEAAHTVTGKNGPEEKTVSEMSTRQLQEALSALKQAQKERDAALAAKQEAENRAMDAEQHAEDAETLKKRAEMELESRDNQIQALRDENTELKNRPVEVAVEKDEAAIAAARKEGVAEGKAQTEQALKSAETAKTAAVKAVEQANKDRDAAVHDRDAAVHDREKAVTAQKEAEKEADSLRKKLNEMQQDFDRKLKQSADSAVLSDPDMAQFTFLYSSILDTVNKIDGLRLKVQLRDAEKAAKIANALRVLAQNLQALAGGNDVGGNDNGTEKRA